MPADQASTTKKNAKAATSQPSPKGAREHRSDDGANILPNAENFVSLVRQVARHGLLVDLLERASTTKLPELSALAQAAKGKLPVESRQAFFHAVGKLPATAQYRIECAAERVMLLDDDYGAQAVLSVLKEERADDAAVLATPSDRYSRALYLHLLQDFPAQGARREERFDQAEHLQVMHRQWKNDHYSSHYLGPKGVVPKTGSDVQEVLRTRIAELFPKVPKDQILIEQFTRRDLSPMARSNSPTLGHPKFPQAGRSDYVGCSPTLPPFGCNSGPMQRTIFTTLLLHRAGCAGAHCHGLYGLHPQAQRPRPNTVQIRITGVG